MSLIRKWRNLDELETLKNKNSALLKEKEELENDIKILKISLDKVTEANQMLTETNNDLKIMIDDEKYELLSLTTSSSFTKADAEEFKKEVLEKQCTEANSESLLEELNKIGIIKHETSSTFGGFEVESKLQIYIKK